MQEPSRAGKKEKREQMKVRKGGEFEPNVREGGGRSEASGASQAAQPRNAIG